MTSVASASDAAGTRSYGQHMNVRRLAPLLAVVALATVPFAGAAQAPGTADQRFVAGLKSARLASQTAFRQLARRSISIEKGRSSADVVSRAKAEIASALTHLKQATQVAPGAIGASDPDIATSVRSAMTFGAQASKSARSGNYNGARKELGLEIDAINDALAKFGVPLASEFKVVGGYRELGNIQGWEEYLGLTAKSPGTSISKVVIGIAGRETANAAEPGGRRAAPSLPIQKIAIYTLQEPSGVYSSGWGKIVNGIIVCDLKPTMDKDETFAISFGPRVAPGTKFLVKLWSTDGRRSYAVVTTK
jgi:hypothetical protein